MNTFIVICKDKKNSLGKRLANRNFHLKYLQTLKEKLVMAGPILDDSENPKGSILVIKFENKKKLEEFLKKDPYTKVNLFETVEIELFKRVF